MSLQQRNNLIGIPREAQSSQLLIKNEEGDLSIVLTLQIEEKLSQLSRIEATVLNVGSDISLWLGQNVSCEIYDQISPSREPVRIYKGVVSSVKTLFDADRGSCIALTVEPWLAMLRYSRNYRVFQQKTTQDIVSEIFNDLQFSGMYQFHSAPTVKREYCLQYNETDLDFVKRLLAEEGMHFYFERDTHRLLLQEAALPFKESYLQNFDYLSLPDGEHPLLSHWAPAFRQHSGTLELATYDPDRSAEGLIAAEIQSNYSVPGNYTLTDFRYPQPSIAGDCDITSSLLESRRAQLDSDYSLVNAATGSYLICSGNYIKLTSHQDPNQLGKYLVIGSCYHYNIDEQGVLSYHSTFSCSSSDHAYYPPLLEKPKVTGMHSAIVAGSTDGDSTCDDEGRIRIKFHWDNNSGDKTSCWVRVAQAMAGSGYGLQFIPRAQQEVLISFLEGDIDRPIVTGSLYNSQHKVPYAEQETTKSGIKTQLQDGSNELRFDDKPESEELFLHAAKDYFLEVENDGKLLVKNDLEEQVDGEKSLQVTKNISTSSEADYSLKAQNITLQAEQKIVLKVGSSQIEISDSKIEIKSSDISLQGSSKVKLEASNVDITASTAFKAASPNTELSGDIGIKVKGGTNAEVSGGAMTTIKGGMVMVN